MAFFWFFRKTKNGERKGRGFAFWGRRRGGYMRSNKKGEMERRGEGKGKGARGKGEQKQEKKKKTGE